MKHLKSFNQLNESEDNLGSLESHIKSANDSSVDTNNDSWAEKMVVALGDEAIAHDSGSAGNMVFYMPKDYPNVVVQISDEGYGIYDRKSDTGDIMTDVPASYMNTETSEPYEAKINGEF